MIIVDTALERRLAAGNPVRVAMVGAGYMARGIALQIVTAMPGIRLVGISNRNPEQARRAYVEAGVRRADARRVRRRARTRHRRRPLCVHRRSAMLYEAGPVEAIIETTGDVEFGSHVAFGAIRNGKHIVLMNAEVDASVGPILTVHAPTAPASSTPTPTATSPAWR